MKVITRKLLCPDCKAYGYALFTDSDNPTHCPCCGKTGGWVSA